MVKLRVKKLLALALSILMLTGTVTDWLPTALAVEEPKAATEEVTPSGSTDDAPATLAEGTTREVDGVPNRQLDFQDPDNGRPNLYVDFLGDNIGNGTVNSPGNLVAPAAYNKDNRTNSGVGNRWEGYTSQMVNSVREDQIIFWVGVGIDRTQVWELLKNSENKGLTSLELGFYYNKDYIEPYVGAGGYAATLEKANITGYGHNAWGDSYRLLYAETDLPVEDAENNILRADPITQDEMKNPSLNNIRKGQHSDNDEEGTEAHWYMTYISLELKDLEGNATRRLAGKYTDYQTDEDGNPIIPPEASGTDADNPAEYLMMIPFVLHKHDARARLCLRLIRDASHFSIGAGNDGVGDDAAGSYAAWERVTTRNEGKDLKLQLRFAGDLNIWGDGQPRVTDEDTRATHKATLLIQNGGGSQNTARLSVWDDKGATPVFVDRNNQTISNLQGGTGMELKLTVQTGYVATVWVYYDGTELNDEGKPVQMGWPFVTVTDQEYYTFVMPDMDVYVQVVFQPGNTRDFTLYLSEIPKPYAEGYMLGNEATVSSFYNLTPVEDTTSPDNFQPVSINSFDPRESHPNDGHGDGPRMMVTRDQPVTLTVDTHPDYEARVSIYNYNSQRNMEDVTPPVDAERDPDDLTVIILPYGGTITFFMPQSDVDVVVEYVKAVTKKAKLEVWHEGDAALAENVKEINIAQLAYLFYDANAAVSTAYSGQVYEAVDPDDAWERNHSAVHDPSKKTAWVPYSAATISNSLGGDTGRTGRIWSANDGSGTTSIMATLVNATGESNLAGRFSALDLLSADLLGNGKYAGLRKNLDGEIYGDGELAAAANLLWELRTKVMEDTETGGLKEQYYVQGKLDDGVTPYYYLNLTAAQVQAYRIDCLKVDAVYRANQQAYRKAYQGYQEAKKLYDEVAKVEVTADAVAPIKPLEPLATEVIVETGTRTYQDTDYENTYIEDYHGYLAAYTDYIEALKNADTPTEVKFNREPIARPEPATVILREPADALGVVRETIDEYQWDNGVVEGGSAEVETTATVATRAGRTVWLLLEADSGYEVASVQLLNADRLPLKDPDTNRTLEARASTSFKNVYTFSMPEEDCIIQVNYKLRSKRNLLWQVKGADGLADNVAHIEAYQATTIIESDIPLVTSPQWDNIYPDSYTKPTFAKRTNQGNESEDPFPTTLTETGYPVADVLVKSLVTIRLTCNKDYKVTVTATNGAGGNPIQVTANEAAGLYTFTVPEHTNPDVVLTITYAKKSQALHRAHLVMVQYDTHSADNTALWNNNSTTITAMSDTHLEGSVSLAPGYYIYTSYAIGDHGSYPYTLDGNGYNNGMGAGNVSQGKRPAVKVESTMPDEDLYIYIIVRQGIAPVEPANALTVIVVDDDNTSGSPVDNWAKATVHAREDDDLIRVEVGAVGKGATGKGKLQESKYGKAEGGTAILTGDRVELEVSVGDPQSYYVAEVALAPAYLGEDLEWLPVGTGNTDKLQFTMPAGSTTVIVRFRKLESTELIPTYYIHALKIETDRDGRTLESFDATGNKITMADSGTIRGYAPDGYPLHNESNPELVPDTGSGRGAGTAGETVTMTFEAEEGWYVQSVAVMTDGSAHLVEFDTVSGDNNGGGGIFTAKVVMPTGDAWFIVKYRECPVDPTTGQIIPRPEVPEYAITLMVIDNDNTTDPPADNTVTLAFEGVCGVTHPAITAGGNYNDTAIQYIHAGEQIDLTYSLAPGYTLEYMIVNPTALGIVPTYVDPTTAQFTMPAQNITVVAKIVKGTPQVYTADLILRPPAGMTWEDLSSVGQGTFVYNGQGSLEDYAQKAIYSLLLTPGRAVDFDLYAFDGYYIKAVTVEPAVGAYPSLTGSFGYQSGGFVMPAANVYVNVYFEKLWPDQVQYDLTLKVNDASSKANNYAHFATVGGADFPEADRRLVHGGESYTVTQTVFDGQEVTVTLNRESGFYYDPSTITVTDSSGAAIAWRMTATGISFLMPPRSTTVEITFRKDDRTTEQNPFRRAVLHIIGTVANNEIVRLYRNAGTTAGDFVSTNSGIIANVRAGDVLHLEVTIPTETMANRRVAAAYAVDSATGEQLMLPITQVPSGGLNSFAVPTLPAGVNAIGKDIDVYVELRDKPDGDRTRVMTLVAQGPEGSGNAILFETANTANTTTATAGSPTNAVGFISAIQGTNLTVTMNPANGYYISQLVVIDNDGNPASYEWISMLEDDSTDPSTWHPNREKQITLPMPAVGGVVQVTYAKTPTGGPDDPDPKPIEYTAQVVVNGVTANADLEKNNAWLSIQKDDAGELIREKLVTAAEGKWIDLDIIVQAGYRILPIFVSPQSFGIQPQLYLGDLDSQTTGFYMPAGDVVVYVEFVRDDLPVYNATLVVKGYRGDVIDPTTDLGTNQATIHSDRTGTRGPIDASKTPVSVQAAANREWVTVEYQWDPADSWVSSLTVQDRAGRNVPFTQVDAHTITLPMVARDIVITVTYTQSSVTPPPTPENPPDKPAPELTPVRLHVIDMSEDHSINTITRGWGRVYYTPDPTVAGSGKAQDTGMVLPLPITPGQTDASWGNTQTIWVPAGRDVVLEAFSWMDEVDGAKIYILSAYVLYRDGGQMIECNLTPNSKEPGATEGTFGFFGRRSATFTPHPDYNDVYVFLTKEEPKADEFSATLMLKSPAGDTGSSAVIWTGTDLENAIQQAGVRANGDHGRITAKRKEKVTVTVTPMEGYAIDYILMTPLGVPITPTRVGNTYTFSMPGYNVSVCVYLKRSNEREYNATVHYIQDWTPGVDPVSENGRATISWNQDSATLISATADNQNPDSAPIMVTENVTVTLDVTLDAPYVVLAAYVLEGGSIVPLAPALEGTSETRSMTDNSLADGTATFSMPSGDVDVYVVTTANPPTGVWHTAVLTVKDPDDSGDSLASIARDNSIDFTINDLPGPKSKTVNSAPVNHDFITVREGQTVTVYVQDDPSTGYTFDRPALLTHAGSYNGELRPVSSSPNQYVYAFTVGNCNSAVLANFKSVDAVTSPLTVVIEDPDNPGDGTVEQSVTVNAAPLAPLTLTSVSAEGAYQVIPNVEDGTDITVQAKAHAGYTVYAYWSYADVRERIPLTLVDGVYTGGVTMPGAPAQITVTYHKTYTATITIHDRNQDDQSSQAHMRAEYPAETAFPSGETLYESVGRVSVNLTEVRTNSIRDLSTTTRLTTTVETGEGSVVTAVLATDATGTHFITPTTNEDGEEVYLWWIDQSDVEIVVIVDKASTGDPTKKGYVASVVTKGKPADAKDPTIAVTPTPDPDRHGSIWSSANEGNTVTVTVPPVEGYRVSVTAKNMSNGTEVTVTPGPNNTYTAIMPAANLEFTVVYEKEPTLTLCIVEPESVKNLNPANKTSVTGGNTELTTDKQTTRATANQQITVTATPTTATVNVTDVNGLIQSYPVIVAEITLRTPTETRVLYTYTAGDSTTVSKQFSMPDGDATVIVRYAVKLPDDFDPDPNTPEDDQKYYTAWVEVKNDDGQPENRVNTIWNVTKPDTYPTGTPDWACGGEGNEMKLSISVKAGYYVTVTAETRDGNNVKKVAVPVIQMGNSGLCSASVTMPGEDVFIIVTYHVDDDDKPDPENTNVTLVLVGHGGDMVNAGRVTGGALGNYLSTNGQTGTHMKTDDITSRVYVTQASAKVGDELRLSADWASSYKIVRATVSLPVNKGTALDTTDGTLPDNDNYTSTELDLSRYGTNATARLSVPGEGVVVTVYYANIFEATLHVERNGSTGDTTHATDDRGSETVTSTGINPISNTGDRLISMQGGEQVQTTAIPGENQRLVGVVWESRSAGASSAPAAPSTTAANRYDFIMPQENVDFYAVYQTEPEDPKDNYYIAKVRFTDDSAHQGDSGNAVTITNSSNSTVSRGAYWTAAKANDVIVVDVKVAPGYKAEIIATHEDKSTDHDTLYPNGHYDFYINRLTFLPNGKDATFTMPAETDATVTIRFTKGYDFELKVADGSKLATDGSPNAAEVTASGFSALRGASTDAAGTITYTPDPAAWTGVAEGKEIITNVTVANNGGKTAPYKVYRATPFTGTALVGASVTKVAPYTYPMPGEDTVETVLFYDEEHPLVAKVEVRGETDINGNSATPIVDHDDPAPKTVTGTVWTTTAAENTIDLTLTLAFGYVAKIRVRRDNENYYNNPDDETKWDWLDATDYKFTHVAGSETGGPDAGGTLTETQLTGAQEVQIAYQNSYLNKESPFPNKISGDQHFRFTMAYDTTDGSGTTWTASDVTVIVEFEFAGAMPQPFNPDNMAMTYMDLDRGFIYGENRGDFALIDIPTLYQASNRELFSTDNYNKNNPTDPQADVKFSFYLYDADRDEYTLLEPGTDVELVPVDEEALRATGDPYNYYDYKTTLANASGFLDDETRLEAQTFTGSRFKLVPTDPDGDTGTRTAGAEALYQILNNLGSLEEYAKNGGAGYRTRLYVMAEDAIGQKSAYTQVWIRPHFSIEVSVISYAPNHATTASLYKLMTPEELESALRRDGELPDLPVVPEPRNFKHYRWNNDTEPYLVYKTSYDGPVLGSSKYYQKVSVMSSELLGGYNASYNPGAADLLTNVLPETQATYAITLEKAADLTYTRVDLDLMKDRSTYDAATMTFAISDIVYLITGDVNGDGYTKWQDYDLVYSYVWRGLPWNDTQTEPPTPGDPNYSALLAAWLLSIHNPDSVVYRCDLNGDGRLSVQDVNLVQTVFDYNRSVADYLWTEIATGDKVLPFGFGGEKNGYTALFSLDEREDVFPVEPDEYWDALVDPDTTEAVPLDPVYVDENGTLWDVGMLQKDDAPATKGKEGGSRRNDTVMETPVGDEVMDRSGNIPDLPAYDPGPAVDLPAFDPEPAWDLTQQDDDSDHEQTLAQASADLIMEE